MHYTRQYLKETGEGGNYLLGFRQSSGVDILTGTTRIPAILQKTGIPVKLYGVQMKTKILCGFIW